MPSTATDRVTNWKVDQLDDQAGKVFLITGANSGVGYEAAVHLRRANADLLVAARTPAKGRDAVAKLSALPGSGSVELVDLDLASLDSVRAAAEQVRGLTDGLDAVINNAGIMQTPEQKTEDGFELQFGTNHLGHFLLNQLLFDLVAARSGRIVPVSSIVHHQGKLHLDDVMLTDGYTPSKAYGQSKLANLMYGLELSRRLEAAGSSVTAPTAHPGYSNTNLQSTGPTGFLKTIYKLSNALVAQKAEDGAVPEVLAAAGTEAQSGHYYGPTKFGDARGPVGDSRIAKHARDEAAAKRLWELSEQLLDIKYEVA